MLQVKALGVIYRQSIIIHKGQKVHFHLSVSWAEENVFELHLLSFPIYCSVVHIAEQSWSTSGLLLHSTKPEELLQGQIPN